MVNALSAVKAALNPIAVDHPRVGSSTMFDASASVAACNLTVASYAWTASGGVAIQSGGERRAGDGRVHRQRGHADADRDRFGRPHG